jgi:hypothetical protein
LPQQSGASLRDKALRTYCDAVLAFIRRPTSAITQREVRLLAPLWPRLEPTEKLTSCCALAQLDEYVSVLAATLEQGGESRERLKKIHANTLLLKRIIAAYYKEFVQLPLLR